MVGHVMHIRREEALVRLVHLRRNIRPPEECLDEGGPIVSAHLQLDRRFLRVKADAVHSLHAGHRIVVAAPDGDTPIGMMLDLNVNRHEGGGAVVLGPVELDAPGNPRAGQADQGRLDHILPVKEVISIRLVLTDMDTPSDLRQDHHPEELILQMHRIPGALLADLADPVEKREWINFAATSLIDALFKKHRVLVRR